MKKKLSILIYSLAGGGAERVVSILLNELKDKFDITLVLMRNKIDYEIPNSIKIFYLEDSNPYESGLKKLLKIVPLALKYKNFCINNEIDISLSFMNRPNYINIIANKFFKTNIKTIVSERATPSLQHSNGIQGIINRYLIEFLYKKANLIITNSNGNRDDLIKNFNIDGNLILTIHNPFDLKKIEKLSQEKVNFDFSKFTFITVGRLDSGKNHKLLIEAFASINSKNIQLIILGDGVLKDELKKQIKFLNLSDRVFLIGFDNNPYKYLSMSNCFVFTSNYEGFPNVLVEALSCRLPIISTDCKSGPREILAPNTEYIKELKEMEIAKYGILIPTNNFTILKEAMEKLLFEDFSRKNYINLSKIQLNDFNKDEIIKEFISIIDS